MPKAARFVLVWSEKHACYEMSEDSQRPCVFRGEKWSHWLQEHTSCAFRGKHGRFTLLKEARAEKQEGYWYAYQRQGKRTMKRYVGRSSEVTTARLEEIARAFQGTIEPIPLLSAKTQIPRISDGLITREHLLIRLDASRQRTLTLIKAPAGSGKTTLVTQWIATRRGHQAQFPPVAWLTLEKQDNDPVRFWRYMLHVCSLFKPNCGDQAQQQFLTGMAFPPEPAWLERVITSVLNEFTQRAVSGILVLDDYQAITNPIIEQSMVFFLKYLPPSIHLIVITRHEPALPLATLRAHGTLQEIDEQELRFSQDEMRTFLQHYDPGKSWTEEVALLDEKLKGWVIGLRLFTLTLPQSPTTGMVRQQLARFLHGHRPLHDYFVAEILDAQDGERQRFLLTTCWPKRLNASLCEALSDGMQNGATMLQEIARTGLFLESLDGKEEWYQYHALFREAMQAEARRRLDAKTIQDIITRASRWHKHNGLLSEAIELAVQGREAEYTASLIEQYIKQHGLDRLAEYATLQRWLEQLPAEVIEGHPLLCLCLAQVLASSGEPDQPSSEVLTQMKKLLQRAETCWQSEGKWAQLGEVYALRAYLAMRQNKQEQVTAYAEQALVWLPEQAQRWRGICLNLLGAGALAHGQMKEGKKLLQEALTIWTALAHKHGARSCLLQLARIYEEEGALHLAVAGYQQVSQEAREVGDREDLLPALCGLARIYYEWNELTVSTELAWEALEMSKRIANPECGMWATLILSQNLFQQGQPESAQHYQDTLEARLLAHPELASEVQLERIHYWLKAGNVTTAQHYLNTLIIPEGRGRERLLQQQQLLHARIYLQQRAYQKSIAELQRLEQEIAGKRRQMEIQLLQARVLQAQGRGAEAVERCMPLLACAQAQGYMRIFLDEGREMITLLYSLKAHIKERSALSYIQAMIQASKRETEDRQPGIADVESLSWQERRVLRLLIADRTYPEIAQELCVSTNTIKTHVSAIYRKLNVHSRREARQVARNQKLVVTR